VERVVRDGWRIAWRVEDGKRLGDFKQKGVFLPKNRSKLAKKRAKIGLF
jgi:hypothetical protein